MAALDPARAKAAPARPAGALAESRNWLQPAPDHRAGRAWRRGPGGRRPQTLQAWKARKAVARLSEPDITPREIESVAQFGRSGLPELFRLFGEPPSSS